MTGRLSTLVLAVLLLGASCTGAATPSATFVPASVSPPAGAVPCGPTEVLVLHHHTHLTLVIRGVVHDVPALIGINSRSICWLHTHDATGVIHIEAADARPLTLGDFFSLWGMSLGPTTLIGQTAGPGEAIQATVNGTAVSGDPRAIVLNNLDDIVVQLGPPYAAIPPYFHK
jgi:hypothetical protein